MFGTSTDAHPDPRSNVLAQSPLPPTDWMAPTFDDSRWHRCRGPVPGYPTFSLLCLREKFSVSDPAKVRSLKFSAAFHGGLVVYLNGKEVARSYMREGRINLETLAEDYPEEAFFMSDGQPRTAKHKAFEELVARQARRLRGVDLPRSLLRKGVNVLGLEIHRAPFHPRLPKFRKGWDTFSPGAWAAAALLEVKLQGVGVVDVVPNTARPKGLQVWNLSAVEKAEQGGWGNPNEPLHPVRIIGTRGGAFSGQIVLSSRDDIQHLKAQVSALARKAGSGTIPSSCVRLRYPLPANERGPRFDALSDMPPAIIPATGEPSGAVQPLWVTVQVPADAAPGEYEGKLSLSAKDTRSIEVPVQLTVCGFRLPDPREFRTFVDATEFPHRLAWRYDVPMWSQEHFALLATSFDLLGSIGNKTVYIPLIARTFTGNEHSMVRWIREADGTYKYDLSIMARYLDLAEKHMGKPAVVCLQIWDHYIGGLYQEEGWQNPKNRLTDKGAQEKRGPWVTVLDVATGKLEEMQLPMYGEAGSRQPWASLIQEVRAHLRARGLDKVMMPGMAGDLRPVEKTVSFWKDLIPENGWKCVSHYKTARLYGNPTGCAAHVAFRAVGDPEGEHYYGWKRPDLDLQFYRGLSASSALIEYRTLGEMCLQSNLRGFSHMTADNFPSNITNDRDRRRAHDEFLAATPGTAIGKFFATYGFERPMLLAPGPEGALSTVRLEIMREGLQECEARIFIEKALTDEALRAKVGEGLAQICQRLLDERTRAAAYAFYAAYPKHGTHSWGKGLRREAAGLNWFKSSDWQKRSKQLYSAAARIAVILEGSSGLAQK